MEWAHGIGDGARAPLWGFVAGGLVLYISYYGVDQSQAQRTLSATDVAGAQRALVFNGMARFPLTLAYAGLGLAIGAVAMKQPALRDAVPPGRLDLLVPRFIELYVPSGARGLLVAAILAAAMSSLDSALNSLSAATLRDFVEPRLGAGARAAGAAGWSRWAGAWPSSASPVGRRPASSVVEGINRIGALFYGPLLAAFACGILDRRARGPAVLAGVAAGLAAQSVRWPRRWAPGCSGCGGTSRGWWWRSAVTLLGSRMMAPPAPTQLVGTTLDVAALRRGVRQPTRQRRRCYWPGPWCAGGRPVWLGVR